MGYSMNHLAMCHTLNSKYYKQKSSNIFILIIIHDSSMMTHHTVFLRIISNKNKKKAQTSKTYFQTIFNNHWIPLLVSHFVQNLYIVFGFFFKFKLEFDFFFVQIFVFKNWYNFGLILVK